MRRPITVSSKPRHARKRFEAPPRERSLDFTA
jgi:hypothetical protein